MSPLITRSLILVLIAIAAGVAHSRIRPVDLTLSENSGPPTAPPVAPVAPLAKPGTSDSPVPVPAVAPETKPAPKIEIHLAEAYQLFLQGKPFFDARHKPQYDEGHIENAILAPMDEFNERLPELLPFKTETVVIYCSGGQCDASHNLAILLRQAGFTNLHIMVDGYKEWEQAGYPVQKAANPGKGG
jgi:rhodanese-related sulfurtransferase